MKYKNNYITMTQTNIIYFFNIISCSAQNKPGRFFKSMNSFVISSSSLGNSTPFGWKSKIGIQVPVLKKKTSIL